MESSHSDYPLWYLQTLHVVKMIYRPVSQSLTQSLVLLEGRFS